MMHHHAVADHHTLILPKPLALHTEPSIFATVVNHHHVPTVLATHILPGLFALLIGAALLGAWEVANLLGFRYGSRWHHAVPIAGVAFGVVSCLLMAARFIYIA